MVKKKKKTKVLKTFGQRELVNVCLFDRSKLCVCGCVPGEGLQKE